MTNRNENDEIVEGEIVGEFTAETYLNLPPVPEPEADDTSPIKPPPFPPQQEADQPADKGRRYLFLRLLMGGTGALALGGSAALLLNSRRSADPTVVILPNGEEVGGSAQENISALANRVAELENLLLVITEERDRLENDLKAANVELDEMRIRCAEAEELNGLWAQLDNVGIDALVAGALAALGAPIAAASTAAVALQTGVAFGRRLFEDFLEALPTPRAGLRWLAERVQGLLAGLETLAETVQEAVEERSEVTAMVSDFVLWVLGRLPFGIGERAEAGLNSMESLINSLPGLTDGIRTRIIDPLADWFAEDDERGSFAEFLVQPIRERVFDRAQEVLAQVEEVEMTYNDSVTAPVQNALDQREALRANIAAVQARIQAARPV